MKSTVPATLVFSESVPNRVIFRIPDSPAVRRRQLSALPAPSEVTRPLPVTTTTGRPALSRMLPMCSPGLSVAPVVHWGGRGRFDRAALPSVPSASSDDRYQITGMTPRRLSPKPRCLINLASGALQHHPVCALRAPDRIGEARPGRTQYRGGLTRQDIPIDDRASEDGELSDD